MITVTIQVKGFDKLNKAFAQIADLPEDPRINPVALALKDYQDLLASTQRPSIAQSGDYFGSRWDRLKPARRKDGTEIPPWGGVKKVHGKGGVKARINSAGQPYRAGDPQLGNRPGGLWDRIVHATPQFLNRGKSVFIRSQFVYSRRQFNRRPWDSEELRGIRRFYLSARLTEYFKKLLP